jgi:hypothetical protein
MWYRVFCRTDVVVTPNVLLAELAGRDAPCTGRFRGDDTGWTAAELHLGGGTPVYVERYLTDVDDLRSELNTWAAYLETLDYSPNSASLMERVIQTRQLVTVRKPLDHANEVLVERVCEELCRTVALRADGVYQVENDGWYAADGLLLVKEY